MPVVSEGIPLVHRALPDGCRGAILRELIGATPAIVANHRLAGRRRLRGYRAETIRKALATLVKDELVREWSGSRYGTVVMLSELAAERFGLAFRQGPETTGDLPDSIEGAFAGACWVVRPGVRDRDRGRSPRARMRAGPADDGPRFEPATLATAPDLLAIAAESFGDHAGAFAIDLVGTTRPGWSPRLEPVIQPDSCEVCGHRPGTRRPVDRLETCLGCLRSGLDEPEMEGTDAEVG